MPELKTIVRRITQSPMTLNFFEDGAAPQPPDKVSIEHLVAKSYPDGWRVEVEVHLTPFQKRPSLEIGLFRQLDAQADEQERLVGQLSIIETMHPKMSFTIHIRGVDTPYGDYTVRAALFFRDPPEEGETALAQVDPTDVQTFALTITEDADPAPDTNT